MALAPYLVQGLQVGLTKSIAEWQPNVDGLDSKIVDAVKTKLANVKFPMPRNASFEQEGEIPLPEDVPLPDSEEIVKSATIDVLNGVGLTDN